MSKHKSFKHYEDSIEDEYSFLEEVERWKSNDFNFFIYKSALDLPCYIEFILDTALCDKEEIPYFLETACQEASPDGLVMLSITSQEHNYKEFLEVLAFVPGVEIREIQRSDYDTYTCYLISFPVTP